MAGDAIVRREVEAVLLAAIRIGADAIVAVDLHALAGGQARHLDEVDEVAVAIVGMRLRVVEKGVGRLVLAYLEHRPSPKSFAWRRWSRPRPADLWARCAPRSA